MNNFENFFNGVTNEFDEEVRRISASINDYLCGLSIDKFATEYSIKINFCHGCNFGNVALFFPGENIEYCKKVMKTSLKDLLENSHVDLLEDNPHSWTLKFEPLF